MNAKSEGKGKKGNKTIISREGKKEGKIEGKIVMVNQKCK